MEEMAGDGELDRGVWVTRGAGPGSVRFMNRGQGLALRSPDIMVSLCTPWWWAGMGLDFQISGIQHQNM